MGSLVVLGIVISLDTTKILVTVRAQNTVNSTNTRPVLDTVQTQDMVRMSDTIHWLLLTAMDTVI